jgi:hypothetical protein
MRLHLRGSTWSAQFKSNAVAQNFSIRSDLGLTVGLTPGAKARGSLTGNADQLRITQKLLLNQEPFVEGPILVLLLSRRPKSVPAIRHSLVLFLGQSKPASAAAWGGWAATRGPVRAHC